MAKKGFTLVELLIVIGILAVLSTATVLILNPSEFLKESRDSTRLSDISTITTAISLLQTIPPTVSMGDPNKVYISIPDDTSPICASITGLPSLPATWFYACKTSANYRKVDSDGWIPINFTQFTSGSVLATLPVDPINTASSGLYYTYTTGSSFKLTSLFESAKQAKAMASDGGPDVALYEKGDNLNLANFQRGLVGYWNMDETSWANNCSTQTVNDSSGNGNHGKSCPDITGPTGGATGKIDKAGSFDGLNDYVSVNNQVPLNPNPFTFTHWIKTTAGGSQVYTIGNAGAGNGYRFGISGGKIAFLIGDGSYTESTCGTQTVNDNNWHLITGVYDRGTAFKCYIDGSYVGSVAISTYPNMSLTAPKFGKPPCCTPFNGLIDDVRIYNRALSATEINAIYSAAK